MSMGIDMCIDTKKQVQKDTHQTENSGYLRSDLFQDGGEKTK